eukprot:Clim_evm24s165 gene=Clim_evmTU24s165
MGAKERSEKQQSTAATGSARRRRSVERGTGSSRSAKLAAYYHEVYELILDDQHPVTGLIPEGSLGEEGQDGNHAWVRFNLYAIQAAWALAIALRNEASEETRAQEYELRQRVVKMMRGLLYSMMRQVHKVEEFKMSRSTQDALHAKYAVTDGALACGDYEWGHLQIDATSLFLLTLAQMTASGLQVVASLDEVAFVQNLVFYIERAYLTPDYGIWERGDKTNHGVVELNASSIGMAKAALEAINDLDLFGARGSADSVIHVLHDEIRRNHAIFESLLPRESSSKECDSALLTVVGYPAFAAEDSRLVDQTTQRCIRKLEGRYGMKRFLRDGYMTSEEDKSRLYYEPWELKKFENIECEWPVFFLHIMLSALFRGELDRYHAFKEKLSHCLIPSGDYELVPQMYIVPKDLIEKEKANPHSQKRVAGYRQPLKWAQSLWIVCRLLEEGYVSPGELDPINRRQYDKAIKDVAVQISIMAENATVQGKLRAHGILSQTREELAPIKILAWKDLESAYRKLGVCDKLSLSGRPASSVGPLSTSKVYRVGDQLYLFTPQFMDLSKYYLTYDTDYLVDSVRTNLAFVRNNWRMIGRPTMLIVMTQDMLESEGDLAKTSLMRLLQSFVSGFCNGVRIRMGRLQYHLNTCCYENLSFIVDKADAFDAGEALSAAVAPMLPLDKSATLAQQDTTQGDAVSALTRASSAKGAARFSVSSSVEHIDLKISSSQDLSEIENEYPERLRTSFLSSTSGNMYKQALVQRYGSVSASNLLAQLKDTTLLQDQIDILHYLYMTEGEHYVTGVNEDGTEVTVHHLLEEVYTKAGKLRIWALVRHTGGMLGKKVDDLAQAVTELLVHQKQITFGSAPDEVVVTTPLKDEEMRSLIRKCCEGDITAALLTEEVFVYLSMFVRSEPMVFAEMVRLRIGLIVRVMKSELARTHRCLPDQATEHLLNLSPYQVKTILHHIVTGSEVQNTIDRQVDHSFRRGEDVIREDNIQKLQQELSREESHLEEVEPYHGGENGEKDGSEQGLWKRRRQLDGALNRVPLKFYPGVWRVLERFGGIRIGGSALPRHPTVDEMTAGEFKFAMKVEGLLNSIETPEWRQLAIEVLMLLSLATEKFSPKTMDVTIDVDEIIRAAVRLYQTEVLGEGEELTEEELVPVFFDSAPSGSYGTITYISRACVTFFLDNAGAHLHTADGAGCPVQ